MTTTGRVASEISAGDELLLTELIFNGVFTDMNPGEIAALLSCFVFDEKVSENLCCCCCNFLFHRCLTHRQLLHKRFIS